MAANNTLYPSLSDIITIENIPVEVEFLNDVLDTLFGKIFFKNYSVHKTYYKDAAFYKLTIILLEDIGIKFLGEDSLKLLFNPGNTSDSIEIPISFHYNWKIIRYKNQFNFNSFDNSIKSILEIFLDIAGTSKEMLLYDFIIEFQQETNAINGFVNDYNSLYSDNIILNDSDINNDITAINNIIEHIQLFRGTLDVIYDLFLSSDSFDQAFDKLRTIFKRRFGNLKFEDFLNILIPQFSLSIDNIDLALEFPRKWLVPVDENLESLPEEFKSRLTYNVGKVEYSTTQGLNFYEEDSFDFTKSMIGNTGLVVEFTGLKLDLRKDRNIPEATADGRPNTFKGVYAQYAAVTLPPKWFNDDEVVGGITAKIAGYNLLIGTGGISGTIALETETFRNSDGTILNYYTDYFQFEYPIQTTHKDVSNNIIVTDINNHTELKNQLETHEATQFVFPLNLTKVGESEPTIYTNVSEYYSYLNTLYNTSDEANRPRLSKRIGTNGFEIWFTSFDMTFQQGHIVESNIQGGLKIPRLQDANGDIANIDIYGHLDDDGGFNVTASEQDGFAPIILPNILDLYINSIEVGRESNDEPFYIGTACDIVFTNEIIKSFIGDQRINVERLRIYSDGSFEIIGGAIAVPTNFSMVLIGTKDNPVLEVSISGINYGSFQEEHNGVMRKYNYFGFDGAIAVGLAGFDARGGAGIKYFFTVDDGEFHSYIKIETIEVNLTIPGDASPETAKVIIKGWLSVNEVEYAGGVSLKLNLSKLKATGSADMRLQPKHPAFLLDASLDIPIPIPIAATGLGITGFRGLLGFRYVAEKEAVGLHSHDDKWYDYYTYPPRGVHVSKFNGPDKTENYTNPVSVGAGVTITTMGSSDAISLRVMVLLSIPNMLMIDGRASILSKEWGLDDSGEPPFFAFMILADNGIEIGAGVDFKLPQNSGNIIDLHVYMQAGYFWDNPSGWYLNLGTREDPITAKVLTLVEMESFLMLSASGIEAGAKVSFDIDENFAIARVKAWLIAEVGGFISFERSQIGGYMTVDAGATVWLFGFIEVGVSFYVHFSVEAAKPFLIYAEIRVCGKIKIGFIKIKVCATVKIKWEKSRHIDTTPIPAIPQELRDQAVKGIHMLTGETFELINFEDTLPNLNDPQVVESFNNAIIPLDTYVDIKFEKAVLPGDIAGEGGIGSYNNAPENYEDLIPPVKVIKGNELRQVKHRYQITDIKIKAAKDGSATWVDYHPYEAVVNTADRNNVDHLRIGHWQKSSKEYNAIRLLATSPFSYVEQGESGWFIPEQLGLTHATFFCAGQKREDQCANWLQTPLNTQYNTVTYFPYYHSHQQVFFNISQGQTSVVNGIVMNSNASVVSKPNTFGFSRSLEFPNSSTLEFKLPEPSNRVKLKLSTNAQSVKVIYYKSFLPEGDYIIQYDEIESINYSPAQLESTITYTNEDIPISKIEVIPSNGNQSQIDAIYEQIEQLFNDTYEQLGNDLPQGVNIEVPLDTETYFNLLQQLEELQGLGCSTIEDDCIKDETICNLYNDLSELFPAKYPEHIESINEINEYLSIYNSFVELIYSQLTEEFVNANLQPTLNEYRSLLVDLITNEGNNDYIIRYYQLREKAQIIVNKLNLLGNCDCSQNNVECDDKDEVVCGLYEEINTIYQNCLQPTDNLELIQQSLACPNEIEAKVKRFNSDHPQYDIINYLTPYLGLMLSSDHQLELYFSENNDLTGADVINIYNNQLIVYVSTVINLVSQLGNCNCENQEEPPTNCGTLLHEICWLSVEDWTYNLNIPGQEPIQEDYLATIEAINNVVDPIWRPNTKYHIEFTVKDIVDDANDHPFKYFYGFKTAGTIGHYHNAPNVMYGNEYNPQTGELLNRDDNGKLTNPDQYALTSLEQYIDYRRSYPNADGNLLQSKPLFYSSEQAKLLLFYIKPYIAHMLKDQWDAYGGSSDNHLPLLSNTDGLQALKVFIQDPVSNIIMEHPMPPDVDVTNLPQTIEEWTEDEEPPMPLLLQFIQNFVEEQGGDCNFEAGDIIKPASQYNTITLQNLKPRKMYTAIFTNTFNNVTKKIHNYVFQTSRYLNFNEQVESYILERDEANNPITKAVFNVSLDLNTQVIDDAYNILTTSNATNDVQESQFVDYLDRILEGVFRIIPLDPPVTTEFNSIRNQNTNDIVALLIRNPEPFNDPKIPLEIIKGINGSQIEEKQGIIAIMQDITNRDTNYHMLYSKDYSQVLIMHSSKIITANSLDIRFQYKLWNGNSYNIEDSVLVENLVLNLEN